MKYIKFNDKTIYLDNLLNEEQWLDLLSKDNIDKGILDTKVYNDTLEPETMWSFGLWLLCDTTTNIASIIEKSSELKAKLAKLIVDDVISATALTQLVESNNNSNFYWLLATKAGQAIMTANPNLPAKLAGLIVGGAIPVAALAQLVEPNNGSVFYFLLAARAGQAIITANPNLPAKLAGLIISEVIPVAALTQLVKPNNDSVFYWLLATKAGQAIITTSLELQVKLAGLIINDAIPINVLCGLDKNNFSALYYLRNAQAGRLILDNSPELKQKIGVLASDYKALATEKEKLFNEKLENTFPGFDKLVVYIYGPHKGVDKREGAEREQRINTFEDKFTENQLETCSISHGIIALPIIVTIANSKKYYELTDFIEYIKQINIVNIGSITGNVIASAIYQQIYQEFDSNKNIDLSEYKIPDPSTKLLITSIVFDIGYVEKIYAVAKDLKITAELEWLNDQIDDLKIRYDQLNKEILPNTDSKNTEIAAKTRELSELKAQLDLYSEQKKALEKGQSDYSKNLEGYFNAPH